MNVDGKLLAEGQLHDGLTFPTSEESRSAAQHTSDEGEQRPKHRLILATAGVEWEPETRAAVALFSTDQDGGPWETRAKSIRTNIGNAQLRGVWPETREQRCWVHRIANVLAKLPKRLHAKAKAALHEVMRAETRKAAQQAIARFEADYVAKYPKAVASLWRDQAELLTFFDFPAEHWIHLRTGNVIESPFATVRLRQRVTKGAGSRQKGLLMAFQFLAMAEQRWRRINSAHLIPLVRAGVLFSDGVQPEAHSTA